MRPEIKRNKVHVMCRVWLTNFLDKTTFTDHHYFLSLIMREALKGKNLLTGELFSSPEPKAPGELIV